jgi:hypothetical protein
LIRKLSPRRGAIDGIKVPVLAGGSPVDDRIAVAVQSPKWSLA